MKKLGLTICRFLYRKIARPTLFLIDAETTHNLAIWLGESLGSFKLTRQIVGKFFETDCPELGQTVGKIQFKNPIGLAAGFDYEANLTEIMPSIGFGFETIGTITNNPYEGNAKPRLGRLKKSKSLLVNKGFKNLGIRETLKKLEKKNFEIPVGLSIGVTNSASISKQEDAIKDILEAFRVAENSEVPFSYYELNISCPNLKVGVEFYSRENFEELLQVVTGLKLNRPLFIKMPIDKSDEEVLEMLRVIGKFPVQGVIFGNLQKDRNGPSLDKEEVAKAGKGNFSGKPTEKRSNELIALAYKNYGKKLTIVGCGGVFSAEDAYKKIKLGASLVQLITGLVYEGPQLVAQINLELVDLLKKDGFSNITEAVGTA